MPLALNIEQIAVTPTTLFMIGDFPFTNSMTTEILVTLIIVIFAGLFYAKTNVIGIPGKFQSSGEMLIGLILDFIEQITGNRKMAIRIVPVIGTLFIFIALQNIITAMVPLLPALEFGGEDMFRTPTSHVNTTVSLSIAMILLSHFLSIQKYNPFGYLGRFFKIEEVKAAFSGGFVNGLIYAVVTYLLLVPLDLISEFAKVISLSLRLFGNIFAGEILIGVILGMFAILLPVPLVILGLFTGFLQAVVFGALVSSYIASNLQ